jgi:hypothetical protein
LKVNDDIQLSYELAMCTKKQPNHWLSCLVMGDVVRINLSDFLSAPWWAGVSGILAIIAVVLAASTIIQSMRYNKQSKINSQQAETISEQAEINSQQAETISEQCNVIDRISEENRNLRTFYKYIDLFPSFRKYQKKGQITFERLAKSLDCLGDVTSEQRMTIKKELLILDKQYGMFIEDDERHAMHEIRELVDSKCERIERISEKLIEIATLIARERRYLP